MMIDLPDDAAALKVLVRELQASLHAHDLLVRSLRAQIARLKKQKFGASSEKIAREIEQLELTLEGLEIAKAETSDEPPSDTDTATLDTPVDDAGEERRKRRRPRVPPDTPRDRHELDPGDTCPDCGGALRLVGEDVSEILDLIAAQLKIIEAARLKKSCRCCEKMVQCPAPQPAHCRKHGRTWTAVLRPGLEV
jgi:transposase